MKKLFTTLLLFCLITGVNAQNNLNGKIYDKHPTIDIAEKFLQSYVKADAEAITKLITDDFKGLDLKAFIQNSQYWANNFINFSIKKRGDSYPDALEYKKDDIWVNSFNIFYGINKKTGFKVETPFDCSFVFNADGTKIKTMHFYINTAMLNKNDESDQTLTNGILYKHHPNIVKVRKMVSNMALGRVVEMYADFTPDAEFADINYPYDTLFPKVKKSIEDRKKDLAPFFENIEIEGIDEIGYPDMLDHEGPGSVVDSWWSMRLINKKTKKAFKILLVYMHTFNADGKIEQEMAFYNGSQIADSYIENKK